MKSETEQDTANMAEREALEVADTVARPMVKAQGQGQRL